MDWQHDASDVPPYGIVIIMRKGERVRLSAKDYDAKRDGAILGKENERGVAINPPASDVLMRKG